MSSSWVVHVFVEPETRRLLSVDNVCTKRAALGEKNVNEADRGQEKMRERWSQRRNRAVMTRSRDGRARTHAIASLSSHACDGRRATLSALARKLRAFGGDRSRPQSKSCAPRDEGPRRERACAELLGLQSTPARSRLRHRTAHDRGRALSP